MYLSEYAIYVRQQFDDGDDKTIAAIGADIGNDYDDNTSQNIFATIDYLVEQLADVLPYKNEDYTEYNSDEFDEDSVIELLQNCFDEVSLDEDDIMDRVGSGAIDITISPKGKITIGCSLFWTITEIESNSDNLKEIESKYADLIEEDCDYFGIISEEDFLHFTDEYIYQNTEFVYKKNGTLYKLCLE